MKTLITLALLAVTTIASAQHKHHNRHHNDHDNGRHNGHYKKHYKHQKHYAERRKYDNHRDCHYYVAREMNRYDFLRLNRAQRSQLQVSLNFLISNNYGPRDYEYRLRGDMRRILTRDQYHLWERRAYAGGGNTFVFNFNR